MSSRYSSRPATPISRPRYDLRAPPFGPPARVLYQAALEQCAWAEEHGFHMVTLSEHHGAEDGYCPSPLVMAAAVCGRTRSLRSDCPR